MSNVRSFLVSMVIICVCAGVGVGIGALFKFAFEAAVVAALGR